MTIVSNGYGDDHFWCFMNRASHKNGETMLTSSTFKSVKSRQRRNISSDGITSQDTSRLSSRKFSTTSSLQSSRSSNTLGSSSDGLELRPPSFFMNTLNQYRTNSTNFNQIPSIVQQKIASNITRATRKMASYIFLQLVQYAPIIIYSLCFLFDIVQSWVYILFIILINLGGVVKTFTFLRNEIFSKQKKPSVNSNCNNSQGNMSTLHSRNNSNNSITFPPKSHSSMKISHRLNTSISPTNSNYSSNSNYNNFNNNFEMMSTIVENDLPSIPNSPTRESTLVVDLNNKSSNFNTARNTLVDDNSNNNNDNDNNDEIIEIFDDDLERDENNDYEWCEDDLIDIDFLVPFIFSDQSFIMRPSSLSLNSESRKIFNRSSLLNIPPSSNQNVLNVGKLSTFNNSYCDSFISTNESIPDPHFHNDGDNSSIS
ncbi:hypothetical protein C1645_573033 [Glomus cerebriforme]|uniref:Uncharacterized protein n=1 Tax=Glomus cerebriforme TaxID=658196 RepID=A0A397SB03_9GLOM|nr:hypothetical protein C1645_573033 [Glomus cerebriforme]